MQIKTILNRIQKHRGFVYGTVQLEEQTAGLAPHRRNRPRCAGCGEAGPVYDRLAPRRFEFVPLWGLRVFFLYMMRRVDCRRCGVTVERVPWADGKHQLTTTYLWFLAGWAKRLSWQEVARVFRTSWDQVFRSVAMAVAWGRAHVDLTGIRAIGIDEIHRQRHVEAVSHRRRQESRARAPHPGSVSYRRAHERRERSGPPRRSPFAPSARAPAAPHEGALAAFETAGEADPRPARPLARARPTQPAGGAGHAAAGMV